MEDERRMRMAVIAGAAKAARFKEENPRATESQIVQHVTDEAEKIISNIDEDL